MKKPTIPDSRLKRLLEFDSLDVAEQITGKDSHDDEPTVGLGMLLMWKNSDHKKQALQGRNDSYWAMPLDEYFEVVEAEGFKQVLALPFVGKWKGEPDTDDTLYVYWKADEGLLLEFNTYHDNLNGGNCYFNLKLNEGVESAPGGFSGHYAEGGYLIADIDCREALRFHLQQYRKVGVFMPIWKEQPFLGLNHWMDWRDENGESIPYVYSKEPSRADIATQERIAMLPTEVREAIRGEGDPHGKTEG